LTRIGLVSNPNSQQNKKNLSAIRTVAAGEPMIDHAILWEMAQLPEILADFSRRGTQTIVINGGDGTVQAALTEILEHRPFPTPPVLAILPGGMTNMTAADVGPRGGAARSLSRLIAMSRSGTLKRYVIERHVLRVENAKGHPPMRAMFFGTAGIVRAIQLCREHLHARGIEAAWATGLTLFGMIAGWLLSGGRGEAFRGDDIGVAADGEATHREVRLLVLATTLERLILRSRPFWNLAGGPVRYTSIAHPPRHLLRAAPSILYGSSDRRSLGPDYVSRGVRQLTLEMDCPFTLDGQLFEPDPRRPMIITAADQIRFARW
jgi:hypothetical protein